jgi:hypothetical protein
MRKQTPSRVDLGKVYSIVELLSDIGHQVKRCYKMWNEITKM